MLPFLFFGSLLQVGNGKVYGPLTDKEFVQKKKELSISTDMELKSVSSYKK